MPLLARTACLSILGLALLVTSSRAQVGPSLRPPAERGSSYAGAQLALQTDLLDADIDTFGASAIGGIPLSDSLSLEARAGALFSDYEGFTFGLSAVHPFVRDDFDADVVVALDLSFGEIEQSLDVDDLVFESTTDLTTASLAGGMVVATDLDLGAQVVRPMAAGLLAYTNADADGAQSDTDFSLIALIGATADLAGGLSLQGSLALAPVGDHLPEFTLLFGAAYRFASGESRAAESWPMGAPR